MIYEEATVSLAAIRDISERQQAHEDLLVTVGRLRAVTDIAVAVGAETDLDLVLGTIVERGRNLVEARALVVLLQHGEELVVSALAGEVDESLANSRIESSDDAVREAFGLDPGASEIVPLVFEGESLGSLVAVRRRRVGDSFNEEDRGLMHAFAASAATAIAIAQSVATDKLRDAIKATERERAHWARELHDETLQGLAAVHVTLTGAMHTGNDGKVRAAALDAVDEVATQIEALRGMITELRPAALDEIGLESALAALAERCDAVDGLAVDCDVEIPDPGNLDDELQTAIYRLAQEALRNVSKHSRVDRAELSVEASNGSVSISVRDDGVGFEPSIAGQGYGMTGMRERMATLGGELDIVSAPGAGTEIRANVPLAGLDLHRTQQSKLNGILSRP
jgi:signal transduction histidine kinase